MDEKRLGELIEGLSEKHALLITGMSAIRDEVKQHGSASVETKTQVDSVLTEQTKLRNELKELQLKFDTNAYGDGGSSRPKSPGEQFTGSDAYKSALASGYRSGAVQIKGGAFPSERKDVTSAASSVGAGMPQALRLPLMIANPHIPLRIRDLLNVIPTNLTVVEFVKYTFTNNAAIVIDTGTTPATREGVLKPKSDMTMTGDSAKAETIAHWVGASKQVVADIPTLRGIIDTELTYGGKLKEEAEILNGDGTAGHLNGLNHQATALNTGLLGASPTPLDKLRAAMLMAEVAQFPVDGHVLNPQDWFNIEIAKDDLGRYLIGNPQGGINQTLWGVPVIKSISQPVGTALSGAFGMGATLYDREEANIEMRDTHADFFVRNMVAILWEERIIFVVTRPQAFVKSTL
jgi:HK97 family phage major capsid protein